MTIQIKDGGYYVRRDAKPGDAIVGPVGPRSGDIYPWKSGPGEFDFHTECGLYMEGEESPKDLVREATATEIEAGEVSEDAQPSLYVHLALLVDALGGVFKPEKAREINEAISLVHMAAAIVGAVGGKR